MLSVTFLGTSAARPTVERNVSGVALVREGETLLFECGEGTQRQMMRFGVSFALSEIFFTHFHADHFLGVIGLVRTLGLQARAEPMRLYGPKGAKKLLTQALALGVERVPFDVDIVEVKPEQVVEVRGGASRDGYEIWTFATEHGGGGGADRSVMPCGSINDRGGSTRRRLAPREFRKGRYGGSCSAAKRWSFPTGGAFRRRESSAPTGPVDSSCSLATRAPVRRSSTPRREQIY